MAIIIKWCNDNQGFLSAVLSLVAVFAAIGIPAFIAYRQNKIALFDKRFESYTVLNRVAILAHLIDKDVNYKIYISLLNYVFSTNFIPEDKSLEARISVGKYIRATGEQIQQASFLFQFINKEDLKSIEECFGTLSGVVMNGKNASTEHRNLLGAIATFDTKYREKIEEYLCITK